MMLPPSIIAPALALLALVTATPASAASPWSKNSADADHLLPTDQAFQLLSAERRGDLLTVSWAIAPGYYLYRKRLGFEVVTPAGAPLGEALLPKGLVVADEQGSTEVYRETLKAQFRSGAGAPPIRQLRVRYQGCADAGVCYPPVSTVVDVTSAAR